MDNKKNEVITDKVYIYESPDGGKTVYKREAQSTKKIKI